MKISHLLVPLFLLLISIPGNAVSLVNSIETEKSLMQEKPGAWLGVRITSLRTTSRAAGETKDEQGVHVEGVVEGSPAAKAGIRAGDRLVTFNDIVLERSRDLTDALKTMRAGEHASVTLLRDGQQQTVEVVLDAAKDRSSAMRIRAPRPFRPPAMMKSLKVSRSGTYGLRLETLNPQLARYFNAPEGKGVLVKSVREESEAGKAGFKAGDVIVHAGNKTIGAVHEMRSVLGAYDAGEDIPVTIIRAGKRMTLKLTATETRGADRAYGMLGKMSPRVFHYKFDGDGMEELDEFEDLDIDIDMSEIDEAVRRVRIILDGKKIELEGLGEQLREHFEQLREDIETEIDAVEIQQRKL